jgi:hypothetical protein
VHWIEPGLPGAGNIQIFNNGEYLFERVSQSYIFEVNPYFNSSKVNTGAYVNPPNAGYYTWIYPNKDAMKLNKLISNQVVWIYNSKNDQYFFSTIGGSEQRLANGNTLICSDTQGHLFEVTYGDGTTLPQVVWEYINPVTVDGIKRILTDQYPMYNSVFRTYRYTVDHPALKGRTLTKSQTITGKSPEYAKPTDLVAAVGSSEFQNPQDMVLQQNYPNPFNPSTTIGYTIAGAGHEAIGNRWVRLAVYDLLGREVALLVNEVKPAGTYEATWNASSMSSGVYICKFTAGAFTQTRTMVLTK